MKSRYSTGKPKINPNFFPIKKEDRFYVISIKNSNRDLIELEGSGPELWSILEKSSTMEDFFDQLEQSFEGISDDDFKEVDEFLDNLVSLKILTF